MFSMCSTRGHVKSHFLSKRRFFKNNLTQHCTAAPSRITFCISSPPSAVRPSADSAGRLRVRRSAQPRRVTSHPSRPQDNSSPGRQTPKACSTVVLRRGGEPNGGGRRSQRLVQARPEGAGRGALVSAPQGPCRPWRAERRWATLASRPVQRVAPAMRWSLPGTGASDRGHRRDQVARSAGGGDLAGGCGRARAGQHKARTESGCCSPGLAGAGTPVTAVARCGVSDSKRAHRHAGAELSE